MKIMKIAKLTVFLTVVLAFSQQAQAQYAYGMSDIVYDSTTKRVTSFSGTALDFWAGLHYDPAVVGGMFQERSLLGYATRTGYADIFDAVVQLRTTFPAPPNTRYEVLSDHYVAAYFWTDIIIGDEDDYPLPRRQWYDPLGFSAFGGGTEVGWSNFRGSSRNSTFYEVQYFYLGTTGKGVIANPTSCTPVAMAGGDPNDSCPVPLRVSIKNQFRGDQDLSASSDVQQALIGNVQLNAETSGGTNEPITFRWTNDASVGGQCATSRVCLAVFDRPTTGAFNTINLEVRQGNQPPVLKSVKVKASLPTISYSGTERPPLVTTATNTCFVGNLGIQNLILGCPDTLPFTRNSVDDVGFYSRAIITPPNGFISDGTTSYVEFRQLIKHSNKRYGPSAAECFVFDPISPNGWREDFNGRNEDLFEEFLLNGFNLRSRFRNNRTGADANVSLEFLDSPGNTLPDRNESNALINKYIREDQFETYVTYFSGLPEDSNFGDENRHALSKVSWNWKGAAEKRGSNPWRFFGAKSPQNIIQLASESIPFTLNDDGERDFTGGFRGEGDFESCSSKPPVTITTKRNIAVWRKTNGVWYVMNPDGSMQAATAWGVDYDVPVPGDYDGDGLADFATYRPDNPATPEDECLNGCAWYIRRSSDSNIQYAQLGSRDDKAVPADYDGDGKTDMAVFRPSNGHWYALRSSDNTYYIIQFGQNGDVPVPSDFDGDGIDEVAVWSPNSATWNILNSGSQLISTQAWGLSTDKPVIGDYDGDGKTDIANWQSNGNWHIRLSGDGQTRDVMFGVPGTDTPVQGDYDGDGKTDIAVWRPNGTQPAAWHILNSSDNQVQIQFWGNSGDVPIPAAYSR